MKRKDVELIFIPKGILSIKSPCIHIAGYSEGWFRFAMALDTDVPVTVCDAWCYRGIWIFAYEVPGGDIRYWVRLGESVGRFVALRDAKCAISVYLNKRGGVL